VPYRIDSHATGTEAFDRLVELGAIDAEPSADGIAALMPDTVTPEQVAQALGLDDVRVSPAVARDAGSVWILRPRPIRIGRLRIIPPDGPAGAGTIRLADSAAFGTGLHPTTALCLEALEEAVSIVVPDVVLDVGTGSGVLSLAALQLGVRRAVGIDIDEEALRAAVKNAKLWRHRSSRWPRPSSVASATTAG